MLEEESSPQVYQNTLSSPLPFQAGDILGFFQHSMSAHLQYEDVGSGHPLHFAIQDSPSNQFNIANSFLLQGMRVLINVETGKCSLIRLSAIVNLSRMFQTLQAVIVVL